MSSMLPTPGLGNCQGSIAWSRRTPALLRRLTRIPLRQLISCAWLSNCEAALRQLGFVVIGGLPVIINCSVNYERSDEPPRNYISCKTKMLPLVNTCSSWRRSWGAQICHVYDDFLTRYPLEGLGQGTLGNVKDQPAIQFEPFIQHLRAPEEGNIDVLLSVEAVSGYACSVGVHANNTDQSPSVSRYLGFTAVAVVDGDTKIRFVRTPNSNYPIAPNTLGPVTNGTNDVRGELEVQFLWIYDL